MRKFILPAAAAVLVAASSVAFAGGTQALYSSGGQAVNPAAATVTMQGDETYNVSPRAEVHGLAAGDTIDFRLIDNGQSKATDIRVQG